MSKIIIAVLASWLLAGWLAWEHVALPKPLVAATKGTATVEVPSLFVPPLETAAKINFQGRVWGLERDGRPIVLAASAPASAASAAWVQWYLLAAAVRPNERFIVIRTGNDPPVTVMQGELLPDGAKLIKVDSSEIVVKPIKGPQRVYPIQTK